MPLTPQQLAKIQQKQAAMPQALQRDSSVDYYHGWFFVTLNTRDNVPVLSVCVGDPGVAAGEQGAARCVYTEVGRKVKKAWECIPDFHPHVTIDSAEFMPEHMHGLLYLDPENKEHLGKIIGGFMGGCSHAYWDTLGIDWRKDHPTRGRKLNTTQPEMGNRCANARAKARVCATAHIATDRDRDHTMSYRGPALFVHGYNDMEPLTEAEVEVKRAYIRDQAKKRLIQGDRHVCFVKHRHQHSAHWTVDVVKLAIAADRFFGNNPDKCLMAQQKVMARLNYDGTARLNYDGAARLNYDGTARPDYDEAARLNMDEPAGTQHGHIGLDYIGNKALLYSKQMLPLVCHRADAARFEEQKAAVLDAARKGWVIVSAFISAKERDIMKQLMAEQLPMVEIMDNGIADKYKGVGKTFYALAENRLCEITPWSYVYQKDEIQVSREMCLVMNELARVISGRDDDWWKR